jgi:hypothetical protein
MKLVLQNGEIKEVDTTFIFNNQYNTTDGKRIMDTEVKYIIDDIRLGEFYCSSVKQGTYDEVAQAIADTRAKIDKCEGCWWFHKHTRVEEECRKNEITEGNKKIVDERTVYEISCAHKPTYGNCIHDIDEKPVLFREKNYCFFCKHPQGIPDMKPLQEFMIANADKYGIVPRWGGKIALYGENYFMHNKLFGSYLFESRRYYDCFELSNARNSFIFYVDVTNKHFILVDGNGYKVANKLTQYKYEYDPITKQHKTYDEPIKNYDKFATWLWQIVDDFNASK